MYKVLVVDDEPNIAEGIRFMIERGLTECKVLDVAYDGLEGYEKALTLRPDIVITDIRMINMNGIEMIQQLKDAKFEGSFIILSGYTDFEYAKKAIDLGVEDYITKPVEETELQEALLKVCALIDEENTKTQKVQKLELKVESYSQNMKEYILKELFDLSEECTEERSLQLSQLGFPVEWKQYVCVILQMNGKNGEGERTFFYHLAREKMEKYIEPDGERVLIYYSDTQAIMVIAQKEKIDYRKIISGTNILRLELAEEMSSHVSAGIGLLHHNLQGLRKSFEEARIALNYNVIKGFDTVIVYDEIRNITGNPTRIAQEDIRCLEECMDRMDNEGCTRIVGEIFKKIEADENLNPVDLQLLSLNLILSGIRKMPFMQFQLNEFLGRNILSFESISKFITIEQLKNWIINILKSINELMLKQNMPEKRDVVEEVKEYLSKNFNQNITLVDISEKFFINPYYFSQLFKKKTGDTYLNHMINLRISRAKKLLQETDLKIYEVCEMVGYTDTNHFSKLFQRITKVKPGEYRKRHQKNSSKYNKDVLSEDIKTAAYGVSKPHHE